MVKSFCFLIISVFSLILLPHAQPVLHERVLPAETEDFIEFPHSQTDTGSERR